MVWYISSNTRLDISFAVHQCFQFTHNTKPSHETAVKMICCYLQITNYKVLVFNLFNKLVVYFHADAYFSGLWGHKKPRDPICDRSRTGFVVTVSSFILFLVSKIQTKISLSTLQYEYVALSWSARQSIPLKSLITEVIDNLGIDSEKLKFVSISTVYKRNNGDMVVSTFPRMTPTSNHIDLKYQSFCQNIGKEIFDL